MRRAKRPTISRRSWFGSSSTSSPTGSRSRRRSRPSTSSGVYVEPPPTTQIFTRREPTWRAPRVRSRRWPWNRTSPFDAFRRRRALGATSGRARDRVTSAGPGGSDGTIGFATAEPPALRIAAARYGAASPATDGLPRRARSRRVGVRRRRPLAPADRRPPRPPDVRRAAPAVRELRAGASTPTSRTRGARLQVAAALPAQPDATSQARGACHVAVGPRGAPTLPRARRGARARAPSGARERPLAEPCRAVILQR